MLVFEEFLMSVCKCVIRIPMIEKTSEDAAVDDLSPLVLAK